MNFAQELKVLALARCNASKFFHSLESRDSQISGIPGGKLQKNRYYIRVPDNHIEGSVSAWLGVTGNILKDSIHLRNLIYIKILFT